MQGFLLLDTELILLKKNLISHHLVILILIKRLTNNVNIIYIMFYL